MDAVLIKFPSVQRTTYTYDEHFKIVKDTAQLFRGVGLNHSIMATSVVSHYVSHSINVVSPSTAVNTSVGVIEMEYPGKDALDVIKLMPDVDSAYTYLLSLALQPKPVA